MNITIVNDYEELSQKASEILYEEIEKNDGLRCCLATGSSPTGMYEKFCERILENKKDISKVDWVKLDEWVGIPLANSSSCESYIRKYILNPLEIKEDNYLSLNSESKDLVGECKRVEDELRKQAIDVCILGLGVNGHLGLNEPSTSLSVSTHIVELDSKSKQHPMLSNQKVTKGISLGMSAILQSKKIIFLVSGRSKVDAYKNLMKKNISTLNPASLLWLHNNVELIVEKEIINVK